ncbi:hypothetical protein OVA24_17095 [Luteolibacter sp. SL250]|uniref:hypothetical protein n=1 Tax=Luteolibacter sp. SL250 TaxID=2995170 RepID=UPI00226D672A|nr:hypothetical protein [Luteolibacter sp. SL250]WAC18950.1 hypothetical protein OVA24_17095 [Luteolibacter sp. SL250]
MRTPTLIVRLIGLYMVLKSVHGFVVVAEMRKIRLEMEAMMGSAVSQPSPNVLLLVLMLLVGILVTWHSAALVRVLTFDAKDGE